MPVRCARAYAAYFVGICEHTQNTHYLRFSKPDRKLRAISLRTQSANTLSWFDYTQYTVYFTTCPYCGYPVRLFHRTILGLR